MRHLMTALAMIVGVFFSSQINAQPWTYDFGTATGTANNANSGSGNTSFFTGTPSGGGTYRVRIGTGSGSLVLANDGIVGFGTGTEAQLAAASGGSTNKFSVYSWNSPSPVAYVKFNFRNTSGSNGVMAMSLGTNTVYYSDNVQYTGGYNTSLGMIRITYSGAAITAIERRISGSFTAIAGSGIAKDTNQLIEIYGNNSSASTDYSRSGTNTLNAQSWDLWVAGTKVSPSGGWPTAGTLAANTNLSGFAFTADGNGVAPANSAIMYFEDLEYSNSLPVCAAPSTQASSISFANVNTTTMDVSLTGGNGTGRVIIMNSTNSFTSPSNGSNPSANTVWANSGEQVVYNGTGTGPVSISGLTQGTTYYFRAYEYCTPGRTYNTTTETNNPNSQATASGPGLSATTLTAFGGQCVGGEYGPNMFTITGANLDNSNVTVDPLSGFTYSTTFAGTYTSSLSLAQGGGAYSQDVYVKFNPIAVTSYDGNIVVGGGSASSINVAASGSGITSAAPSLGTPTSSGVTSTSATLGATISSLNCSSVTVRGVEWSLTNGFANGTGTAVSETGTFSTGAYTENVTGLPGNSTVYWKAFATNGNGTTYTAQQSITTTQEFLSVGDISIIAINSSTPDNFAFVNWVDINPNMVIKFTDGGFNGTAPNSANTALNARGTENFVIWRNNTNAIIAAGTVIKIEGLVASIGVATAGSGGGLNGLSGSGDQIFAYQGNATTGANPDYSGATATVTFTGNILFGVNAPGGSANSWLTSGTASSNDSYLPTELNNANGNIALPAGAVGGQYTGSRSALGSIIAYRALVNNPANWTTVTGSGLVTVDQTAFTINPNPATQVVFTTINGGVNPSANTPFAVNIEVRDASNNPAAVAIDTDFEITLSTGSGLVSGTLTGTITAGSGTYSFTGVVYNTAETGVSLQVDAIAGQSLTPSVSSAFTVEDAADHVTFVAVDNYVYTNNIVPTFNVQALRPDNSLDVNYNGSATVSLISGTGNIIGTLTATVTAGIAYFNDIAYDTPGVKQLDVTIGSLPVASSISVTVSSASVAEVFLPLVIEGTQPTNSNRIPYAFRLTLNGLKPNSTFRYYPGAVISSDAATSNGAGNAIYPDAAGYVRSTSTSLATAGNYGEFTTNGSGSYTGWFVLEPTGNSRFTSANDVFMRLIINNGNGGTAPALRLTTTNTAKVNTFGTAAANGTALRGSSSAAAKNFVLLYDNEAGTGRPVTATFVESDGSANTTANSYPTFYETNVEGTAGAYGTIIPNTLPNGIRRIEQRQLSDASLSGCAATDADGIWPSGVNTVNPNGGLTTIRVITSTDAPLIASPEVCGNYVDDNCDGNVDELCPGNFVNDIPGGAANVVYSSNVVYPNCYPINGDNSLANNSAESGAFSGPDSWYRFVAQSTAASITLNSSTMDDAIALYSKSGLTYTLIDSENVGSGAADFERMNVSGLTPGTTYYVSVGAASGVTGGAFTLCIQHLMPSGCSYAVPVGGFGLCNNYKAIYRGSPAQGVTYNFNFTGVGGGASGTTSVSGTNGLIILSNPSLALRYGGIYDVQVDANYALLNGAGATENIVVFGNIASANCSGVTMMAQPNIEVKMSQRCPASLLRSNYLIGTAVSGNASICAAISYTYEFTQLDACGGTTQGLPVEYTTPTSNPYLPLGNLPALPNAGAWRVRIRPNFGYGNGSYGPVQDISVNNSAAGTMLPGDEMMNDEEKSLLLNTDVAVYPNPNNGEIVNINLTGIDSDHINVRVINQLGMVVYNNRFIADGSLNTIVKFAEPLSSGLYFVEFSYGSTVQVEKMIVQK